MSNGIIVQYIGFVAKPMVREYAFSVRETLCEPREYTVSIANTAFDAHRVRYQDAPDICSLRLHHELAASENHPEATHYRITDAELDDYRTAHAPRPSGRKS